MKRSGRIRFLVALLALLLASGMVWRADAFDYPLSAEAVRQAYFLGTSDAQKRGEFFEEYTRHVPAPKTGANIALIEVETPFAWVTEQVATRSFNYHAPDAAQDFAGKPGLLRVRAEVYFTPTYPDVPPTARPEGFWQDFDIRLEQSAVVPPLAVKASPIYDSRTTSGYIGAEIIADYDPESVASGPAIIEVTGPQGARAEARFDLDALR